MMKSLLLWRGWGTRGRQNQYKKGKHRFLRVSSLGLWVATIVARSWLFGRLQWTHADYKQEGRQHTALRTSSVDGDNCFFAGPATLIFLQFPHQSRQQDAPIIIPQIRCPRRFCLVIFMGVCNISIMSDCYNVVNNGSIKSNYDARSRHNTALDGHLSTF